MQAPPYLTRECKRGRVDEAHGGIGGAASHQIIKAYSRNLVWLRANWAPASQPLPLFGGIHLPHRAGDCVPHPLVPKEPFLRTSQLCDGNTPHATFTSPATPKPTPHKLSVEPLGGKPDALPEQTKSRMELQGCNRSHCQFWALHFNPFRKDQVGGPVAAHLCLDPNGGHRR